MSSRPASRKRGGDRAVRPSLRAACATEMDRVGPPTMPLQAGMIDAAETTIAVLDRAAVLRPGIDLHALLRRAAGALCAAKVGGRACVRPRL